MFNILNLLEEETPKTGLWENIKANPTMFIILAVLLVFLVVSSISGSKKRKKQAEEDQKKKDSLCPGTTVITIGGIIGTVVSVDNLNNCFVMETEGNKMKFDKRAIYQMTLPQNAQPVQPAEEVKEEVKNDEYDLNKGFEDVNENK